MAYRCSSLQLGIEPRTPGLQASLVLATGPPGMPPNLSIFEGLNSIPSHLHIHSSFSKVWLWKISMVGDAKLEMGNYQQVPAFKQQPLLGRHYNPGIQASHSFSDYNPNSWPHCHKALHDLSPDHLLDLSYDIKSPVTPASSALEDAKPFPASETCHLLDLLPGNILPVSAHTFIQPPSHHSKVLSLRLPLSSSGSSLVKHLFAFCCPIFSKSKGWAVSCLLGAESVMSVNTRQVTVVWMNG